MGILQQMRSWLTSPTIAAKAIGSGYSQVPTVIPQGYDFQTGTQFLNFLQLESLEDGPKQVVVRSAYLQNSWVYSACQVMATNFAQAKVKIMQGEGEQSTEITRTSPSYGWIPYLFDYVSPTENKYSLWEALLVWLAMCGECFWYLKRATNNTVSEIDILPPPQMKEVLMNGKLTGWIRTDGPTQEAIPATDIVLFKYYNPYNKFRGISPLTASSLGIHIDFAASLFNYFFFQNDATPNLVITTDQELDDEKAATLKRRWIKQHGGINRRGSPAFLGNGTKPVQMALAQKDIMYIEQKKWSREEVFAVLNVPPALSQVLEFASIKSNIKEQRQQLYENNLIPKMRFVEAVTKTQFFDRENLNNLRLEFDTTDISALKETVQEKIMSAKELFYMGVPFNTINDKLKFGFDPLPWGDQGYIPMSLLPADEPRQPEPAQDNNQGNGGKPVPVVIDDGNGKLQTAYIRVKKRVNPSRVAESIISSVDKQETAFKKALREYFHKMGSDALNRVYVHKSVKMSLDPQYMDLLPEEHEYDKLLLDIATPIFTQVIEIGIKGLSKSIGRQVSLSTQRALAIANSKAIKLVEVNDTIREQIIDETRTIIDEAIRTGRSYQDVADQLASEVTNIFNNARRRTETVARTEINGTLSASRSEGMKEAGVEEIQWISPRMIRPSHVENNMQHRKYYVETFPSGIYEPYDPSAPPEEVISCSCVAVPYEFEE